MSPLALTVLDRAGALDLAQKISADLDRPDIPRAADLSVESAAKQFHSRAEVKTSRVQHTAAGLALKLAQSRVRVTEDSEKRKIPNIGCPSHPEPHVVQTGILSKVHPREPLVDMVISRPSDGKD